MTKDADQSEPAWWFNLKSGQVEFGLKTAAFDRVGPFDTAEEAARALETIAARAQAWADEEKRDQ